MKKTRKMGEATPLVLINSLKLKLTALLLLLSMIQANANFLYGQKEKITLKMENVSLDQVLSSIEAQSDYRFIYKDDEIDYSRIVSINTEGSVLAEVLKELFNNTAIQYHINGKQIILKPSETGTAQSFGEGEKTVQRTVQGTVLSKNDGLPLPGVAITIKGSTKGVMSDLDGQFSIQAEEGDILVISYMGYKRQELRIQDQTLVNIQMEEDTKALNEVVVVGYGTQKKANMTGAIQTQNFDEAVNTPVANTAQLMYGKFSGVNMTQNSGLPGSDGSSIVIRGVGTFGNTAPLVVIDGMQFEGLAEFNRLSPSDIKSITVLKDASSVAIYGARGANGVILVETKEGIADKFRLEYNNYFGSQEATVVPEYLNAYEYATIMNEVLIGWANGNENAARYSAEDLQQIKDGSNPDQFANTNWVEEILQSAPIQNHHLSLSGGNSKTKYRLGLGYLSQGSIIIGKFDYDRISYNFHINSTLNNWLRFDNTLLGAVTNLKGPSNQAGRAGIITRKFSMAPTIPVSYSNGYYGVSDGTFRRQNGLPNQHSPLEEGYIGETSNATYNINDRLSATITPFEGLTFESAIAINLNFADNSNFVPSRTTYWWDGSIVTQNNNNSLENAFNKRLNWMWENILRYDVTLSGEHSLGAILGYSSNYFSSDGFSGRLEGFPTEYLQEFNAGGTLNPTVNGDRFEYALQSVFGRVNYSFKNRYLFEANLRRDGSSRFGPGNRFAYFPSFSAGWLLSEEPFLKNAKLRETMNYLKLRASWGRTGNNRIGNYIWDQTYNTGVDYILGNGNLVSGVAITSLANEQIRWETTEQFNIGLDAGFFNDKLSLMADFFNRNSYDILYANFPIPSTLGVNSLASKNSAKVRNNGIEVNLNYQKRGDFSYNIGVNFTKMFKQEVTDLGDGIETIAGVTIITENTPFRSYYGYKKLGIFQSEEEIENAAVQFGYNNLQPGDIHYADLSGPDGKPDGVVDAFDRTIIGNPHPEWIYGAYARFSYKGFDLDIAIQGLKDVDRFIQDNATYGIETRQWNAYRYWVNRWTPENPGNDLHRLGGTKSNNIKASTRFIEDGSYMRVKNIEIGYSLPKTILENIGVEKIRLFLSGQNLFTFTNMNENLDPERNMGNTNVNNVPIYKVYTAGLNIAL